MDPIGYAVLIYVSWMLFLLGIMASLRVSLVLSGKRHPSSFAPSGEDVSKFAMRLARTHANGYENLPVFLGIVLVAFLLNRLYVLNDLAFLFISARLTQGTIHLISTRGRAVQARFFFMILQWGIQIWWVIALLKS